MMKLYPTPLKKRNKQVITLQIKKSTIKVFILLTIVICIAVGLMKASKVLQTKGYNGVFDFISSNISNYKAGLGTKPESISIQIDDKDFKKLEKNRDRALERGLIINELDGEYVSATLEYKGEKLKVKLRLKGHMTDHLQPDKWSFRIKIKGKGDFMGMKRFSIQHPGTRGYIYEWVYHELMKREDIIALRYKFINVSVNGKDWGIYAVEENFENELIENNHRVNGPILRFNPDLYWVNRRNEYEGTSSYDEYASYYSASPEAYREEDILKDTAKKANFLKALALVEGLRSREVKVSTAFDIKRLAKFHAIIDLVGGEHSIDWSDIKYYYNAVTGKLEPVAYESFTYLLSTELSGAYKYVLADTFNYKDWHTMIFSDPVFFAEYIHQLQRVTNPGYLDAFFKDTDNELNKNLAILYKEFPYKKFDKQDYYWRQQMIRKIINPPKAIHAYFEKVDNEHLISFKIAPIDAFPVKIIAARVGNNFFEPLKETILPAKQKNEYLHYHDVWFKIPEQLKWSDSMIDSLKMDYQVLGSEIKTEIEVFPYPHPDTALIKPELDKKKGNMDHFSFLKVDKKSGLIMIMPGKHVVQEDIIIPEGYNVLANAGVSIDFIKQSKFMSYSPLLFSGTDETPVLFESSDHTFQGIELINAKKSVLNYFVLKNATGDQSKFFKKNAAVTFYESPVEFNHCGFYHCGGAYAFCVTRSDFLFSDCIFKDITHASIQLNFSKGNLTNCIFENCLSGLSALGSKLDLNNIYVKDAKENAFIFKEGAQVNGVEIKISNAGTGITAENFATVNLQNVSISGCTTGVIAYKKKMHALAPVVTIRQIALQNLKKDYLVSESADVSVDGKAVAEKIADEAIKAQNEKREIN